MAVLLAVRFNESPSSCPKGKSTIAFKFLLQRRYSKTKKDPPVPEGRGEAAAASVYHENREAWSLFSAKAGYSDHLQPRRLTPALRDGVDLESSLTGAEADI